MQQSPSTSDAREASAQASSAVWRLRIVAVCVGLTALAFLSDPGLIVVDTKVDLVIDPAGWLTKALHIWDPSGTFGQLQNQAYGYLWPMGSFFLAGKLLTIPAWVVQRLWWAVVMSVAFTGVVRLADRLGVGTPWARLLAGIAFALSPRMITELGPISVEAWPSAVAPWVLVPLIGLAHGAPVRRAVTRSAVAVACAGGVNATAVLAVMPLAMLWLAGLRPAGLRWRASIAWCVAVGCAIAWWLVPLLTLGRFSPPFLDYIETAPVTTSTTDAMTVLRGTSHWQAYLGGPYGPTWLAGWRLATERPLIIASLVVAALGVAGLSRRGMPYRRFLVTGLLAGLAMVSLGHIGQISGLFAEEIRAFLDAGGAPLRNIHKFDVVLRLPLALGLAHLTGLLLRTASAAPRTDDRPAVLRPAALRAGLVTGVAVVAVAAVAGPALGGGLAATGSFARVPGYWTQAQSWLDDHLDNQSVLVVPGARFPRYTWGAPSDEMIQPLLHGRWGVRSSIPLTPPATIRLLDSVQSAIANGQGSTGLADLLARSGVRYLLLRSDLDYGRSGAVQPVVARQGLQRSPGLRLVTGFGPRVGGGNLPRVFTDYGLNVPVRALEIYEIEQVTRPVVAHDADSLTTVVGGPESLLSMAAAGLLPAGPTVLAGDRPATLPAGPVVLTDGMRRREVSFGRASDASSATLRAGEKGTLGAPARDYLPAWGDTQDTVASYLGIEAVTASSSYSDAQPLAGGRPDHQPYAAVDGDPSTSWRSAPGTVPTEQWLKVVLKEPRVIHSVRLTFDQGADTVANRVTVSTGQAGSVVANFGVTATVELDSQVPTREITVSVNQVFDARAGFGGVGLAELEIPGVKAERTLVVPPSPVPGQTPSVVLSAAPTAPSCYFDGDRPVCSPWELRASEDGDRIDRTVPLPTAADYRVRLQARPRLGAALDALLDTAGRTPPNTGAVPTVTASSLGVPDPVARPGAVADGDPTTIWYASVEDHQPWLRLSWPAARVVSGIRLTLPPDVAAAHPWQVTLLGDDGIRKGYFDSNGQLLLDRPMITDDLTVLFTDSLPAISFDPYRNVSQALAIGVGEVTTLPDGPIVRPDQDARLPLPCGSGPTVTIGGVKRTTAMVATRRDLVELREIDAVVCGAQASAAVPTSAGAVRMVAQASSLAMPTRLTLTPAVTGSTPPPAAPPASPPASPPVVTPSALPGKTPSSGTSSSKTPSSKGTPSKTPSSKGTPSKTPSSKGTPSRTPSSKAASDDGVSPSGGQGGGVPTEGNAVVETPVQIGSWAPTLRRVTLGAYPNRRVLTLRENTNIGWSATIGRTKLAPLVVDGWQQGWIVPAGAQGEVVMQFAADRVYGAAIGAGAVLLAGVGGIALLPAGFGLAAVLPRRRGAATPAPTEPSPLTPAESGPRAPVESSPLAPAESGQPVAPAEPAAPVEPAPASASGGWRRRLRALSRSLTLPLLVGGVALAVFGGVAAGGVVLIAAAPMVAVRAVKPHLDGVDRRILHRAVRLVDFWIPLACFAVAGWLAVSIGGHTAALPQLAAIGMACSLWLSVSGGRRRGH